MANYAQKVESERKAIKLTHDLSNLYEKDMKEGTAGKEYLKEKEFDDLHTKKESYATRIFMTSPVLIPAMMQVHATSLRKSIEKICERFKRQNEAKRKIVEEQNAVEKFLMVLTLDSCMNYRETLAPYMERYVEESELERKHNFVLRSTLDKFEKAMLDFHGEIAKSKMEEYAGKCKEKIKDEYQEIIASNLQKKKLLKMGLEGQRAQIYVEYDNFFANTLKDDYIEPSELLNLHKKVVDDVIVQIDKFLENRDPIPLYTKHKQKVREELERRYSATEKRNEKNNTFFKKFVRVVKTIGMRLLKLAPILVGLL